MPRLWIPTPGKMSLPNVWLPRRRERQETAKRPQPRREIRAFLHTRKTRPDGSPFTSTRHCIRKTRARRCGAAAKQARKVSRV